MQLRYELGFTAGEPRQDIVAIVFRGLAVEVLGAHAGAHELVTDMQTMGDVAGESDGLPALAEFVPVGDDVADELGVVHALGELALDVVTAPNPHAKQVWSDRRIDARLDQVAQRNECGICGASIIAGEDAAEAAAVTATGRGRQIRSASASG